MAVVQREDGAAIWWDAEGEGDPVLLIMGLAWPAEMWFRQVPALAAHYRVIRLDNRGAGHTGDVVGAPYTVETMTADCLAVLDAAGVESAHVVGISMGGLMAQEMAMSYPHRVRSLVLMASHPGAASGVWDLEVLQVVAARAGMSPEEAAEVSIPFNYSPTTPRERIEEDWAVRLPLACSAEGYTAQGGTAQWNGIDRLGEIKVPTLVINGALDRLVLRGNAEILADRIPGAELVIVEDANHVLTTDQPERVNHLLLDWLGRHG